MTRTESPLSNSTMSRLLDGAERSLAYHGYKGSSIRRITREAGTNVASVNYYFGSKKALFAALFRRRLNALAQLRAEALDAIQGRAEYSIDDVVQAYFGVLFHLRESAGQEVAFVRWMLLIGDPELSRLVRECVDGAYIDLRRRYAQALAHAAPAIPVVEFELRLEVLERFALCAMAGPEFCWTAGQAALPDVAAVQPGGSLSEGLASIIGACIRAPLVVHRN